MKLTVITLCLCLVAVMTIGQILTPRQTYPSLFEAVQQSDVFPDNKTFVDMVPKVDPRLIMQMYNAQRLNPDFNLKTFVYSKFSLPNTSAANFTTDLRRGVRFHIDTLWQVLSRRHDTLSRSSLLPLRFDYIVPGGRFREIYYWDSYFTMLGLQESGKAEVIDNMIKNFADLIDRYGFIPNGTRSYYLSRSQPPFFSVMLDLLVKDKGEQVFATYQAELLKEYAFWMKGAASLGRGHDTLRVLHLPDGAYLNRYWDNSNQPREESYKQDAASVLLTKEDKSQYYHNIRAAAESGWDFSTRWFGPEGTLATIHTTDLAAIDLNCLLFHLENSISRSYGVTGDKSGESKFKIKAEARGQAIQKYCWDPKAGWFKDYNFKLGQGEQIETLAGMFPLEFGIARADEAAKVALTVRSKFLQEGGLVTTLNRSGQQWDSPNGWAPLEYIAIDGLRKYGFNALSKTIATRWISLNLEVFRRTGKLVEKYNVIDTHLKAGGGEYTLQDGFGWTNGVLLNLLNRYQPE